MDILMHWLLVNVISALMLPLFMVATLCFVAGARPEPVMRGFLDMFASLLVAACRLLETLLRSLYEVWRSGSGRAAPRPLPKPGPGRRPRRGVSSISFKE